VRCTSWLPQLRGGLDSQDQAGAAVPGTRGDPPRYTERRPGGGLRHVPGATGPAGQQARNRATMTRPLRQMLSALRRERAGRGEIERLAGEQAALRRVAALVAKAPAPEEIFAAVAGELAQLSGAVITATARPGQLRPGAEHRLAAFAELMATAIASAQARAELTACRARMVAAADETRRRIERDLHDGAQQRLVSVALRLRAAQETVPPGLGELRAELGWVAGGLAGTLDELREYARGVHPAVLADGGLAPALKTLARRSPVRVTLGVQLPRRLHERVEVTAYYVVSEALANAAKHAEASAVRDDGGGGADPARGSGLMGLQDRVEAIGGILSMRSRPGEGTTLLADLPARPGQSPPAGRSG
jgi:signal transduction histidine kinase